MWVMQLHTLPAVRRMHLNVHASMHLHNNSGAQTERSLFIFSVGFHNPLIREIYMLSWDEEVKPSVQNLGGASSLREVQPPSFADMPTRMLNDAALVPLTPAAPAALLRHASVWRGGPG